MYSGIVQEVGVIESVEEKNFGKIFSVSCSSGFLRDIKTGASVALNGTCFSVTDFDAGFFKVEATRATLEITNLGEVSESSRVNLERSLRFGDENGGHNIAGHVAGTSEVVYLSVTPPARLVVRIPEKLNRYFFEKGFIALNGMSLTVAEFNSFLSEISINLIPETIRVTNISDYKVGDRLNLEIDAGTRAIVDTIESVLRRQ